MSTDPAPGALLLHSFRGRLGKRNQIERWRTIPTYGRLIFALALIVVSFVVAGFVTIRSAESEDASLTELGKWFFTAGAACLTAGLFATLFRVVDERRTRRIVWEAQLYQIVEINQRLRSVARMVRAHPDTRTLQEQFDKVIELRGELRSIAARGNIAQKSNVGSAIRDMLKYLRNLCRQYERLRLTSLSPIESVEPILQDAPLLEGFIDRKNDGEWAVYSRAYRSSKSWLKYYSRLQKVKPEPYVTGYRSTIPDDPIVDRVTDAEDADENDEGSQLEQPSSSEEGGIGQGS